VTIAHAWHAGVLGLLVAVAPASAQTTDTASAAQLPPDKGNGWYRWENRAFTAQLTLSGLYDFAAFVQDDTNNEQVGRQPVKGDWRAERVLIGGQLNFAEPWTYLLGANFNSFEKDDDEDYFGWMDIRVDIPIPRVGRLKVGRQKVGVSQEWMMPGLDWIFMERSTMNSSFVPQRNVGMQLTNTIGAERGSWSIGWFNDWFVTGRKLSDGGNQFSARLNVIALDRDRGATLVQVAAAGFYKQNIDGGMRFRSRPEVNQSEYFIDTGEMVADHSWTSQFELMALRGPAQFFGELALTPVTTASDDPFFYGFYAGASYFLTGEHRGFNRRDGYYQGFAPKSPFSFGGGGRGAWEVSGRYSRGDLSDQGIDGGTISRITGALAWYPTRRWRFEFNYGFGVLTRGGSDGRFNAFQGRLQWSM
jgi:phosphate-selective porin OprO/OprP